MNDQETTDNGAKPADLLPLDAERVVAFSDRGKFLYTFQLRRLTAEDWEHFFNGIVVSSQTLGDTQKNIIDMNTPGLDLVQRVLTGATGYAGEFTAKKDWQKRVPPGHIRLIAELLRDVRVSEKGGEGPIDPDRYEVELVAKWNANAQGQMLQYDGLAHRFDAPTAEHQRKYNRAMAESRVVGGTRTGTTIYVPRQKVLVDFYDELVSSVSGYSVSQLEITSAEDAKRHMDAYHKVMAVQALFAEPEVDAPAQAAA